MSDLLIDVIMSWQVIAVTIAIVIYLSLVFYVAKAYRRPRVKSVKVRMKKYQPAAGPEETGEGENSNDELGLEEA